MRHRKSIFEQNILPDVPKIGNFTMRRRYRYTRQEMLELGEKSKRVLWFTWLLFPFCVLVFRNPATSVADSHPACHFDADPDLACHFDADPNPSFHFDAGPNPDLQLKAPNLEKVLIKRLIFHTFWLDIHKLMRIRIRMLPFNLMWIRIRNTACH